MGQPWKLCRTDLNRTAHKEGLSSMKHPYVRPVNSVHKKPATCSAPRLSLSQMTITEPARSAVNSQSVPVPDLMEKISSRNDFPALTVLIQFHFNSSQDPKKIPKNTQIRRKNIWGIHLENRRTGWNYLCSRWVCHLLRVSDSIITISSSIFQKDRRGRLALFWVSLGSRAVW